MSEKRNDATIQEAVRAQFIGIAPEREKELNDLWESYGWEFRLFEDQGYPMMEGGAYRYVHFNHRALRVIWVSAFAAWEAYRCAAEAANAGVEKDLNRLRGLLTLALEIRDAEDPEKVPLGGVPEPGVLPDASSHTEDRAASELAIFASGWAMLHEVHHLKRQQDGNSSQPGDSPAAQHAEELSCDSFATDFILANVQEYAESSGQPVELVRQKRGLGVYFAMFALSVLAHENWHASETHPAIQTRLNATRNHVNGVDIDATLAIAALAFSSLQNVWPGAPKY